MSEHKAGEMEVRGRTIQIYVDDYGRWFSKEPDVTADSRNELREKLVTVTRKQGVKLAIPATLHERGKLFDATLFGRHGGNGNLMFSTNGKNQQETYGYYVDHRWMRRMTAEEKLRFRELRSDKERAERDYESFAKSLDINPDKLVDAELEKAVSNG